MDTSQGCSRGVSTHRSGCTELSARRSNWPAPTRLRSVAFLPAGPTKPCGKSGEELAAYSITSRIKESYRED